MPWLSQQRSLTSHPAARLAGQKAAGLSTELGCALWSSSNGAFRALGMGMGRRGTPGGGGGEFVGPFPDENFDISSST